MPMRNHKNRLAGGLTALLLILGLDPALPAQPVEPVPTTRPNSTADESRLIDRADEIVTVLANGMTAIVLRYAAAPVASVRMHVRAGSIWEDDYAGAGISHLFEHLLHRATTAHRSEQDSRLLLEQIGAETNAFTSHAQTVYYINVPKQHAGAAIDLLADWITRPTFPEAEVQRELGVVQRELERGLQEPDRQLWTKASELRYRVHPARFPVIGLKAALAKLTRDDILAYYRRMYVPARAVLAVVGDIDPQATLAVIKKEFADFAARADQPTPLPDEPEVVAPRSLVYPMDVAQVRFVVGFPTVSLLHEDLYPLDVMAYVLGAGQSSRLVRELRDRRKLALTIGAGSDTPAWGPGAFYVTGLCEPENWPTLRDATLAEFDRLAREPVEPTALAQAKRQALVEHIRGQQTAATIAGSMASNQLSVGDAHFDEQYIRRLGDVTAEQVQEAARKYFDRRKLLTTLVVPRDFKSPPSPGTAIPGLVSSTRPATAPKGGIEVAPIRRIVLENGLTVLLRRNTAVPLAAMQMHFAGGLLGEQPDQAGVCRLMVQAALRGTGTRTANQIFDAFEQAGGSLASDSGRNSFSFSASTLADQLPAVLPVFADVVLNPTFPADEVEKLKARTLAAIARIDDRLDPAASRFFFARFFDGTPYGRIALGNKETVAGLTGKELAAFHDRFVAAPNAVLAVFGDIDLDRTAQLVGEQFGRLRPTKVALAEVKFSPPAKDAHFVQPTRLAEAAQVDIGFPGVTYTDDDNYPLILLDTITSGYGLPGGWLHETLRGRQLVYVVHAQNIAWSKAGVFYIFAQCQPAKVKEVAAAINELMGRARRGEFTESELTRAKGQVLGVELMDNQTNDELAFRCALDELLGRGYDNYLKLADRITAVTLEDVRRVASKYLTHSVTTVTTGDPKAAE